MTQPNARMNFRKINDSTGVIEIYGEVTAAAENILMEAYGEATEMGVRTVILDFSHLEYMNSSGIGLLVTLLIRVKRQNQRLYACGLSSHYQQIFELTRLNEAINICETIDEVAAVE